MIKECRAGQQSRVRGGEVGAHRSRAFIETAVLEVGEGDREVKMSSYKMNQSCGCNVQCREYSQ